MVLVVTAGREAGAFWEEGWEAAGVLVGVAAFFLFILEGCEAACALRLRGAGVGWRGGVAMGGRKLVVRQSQRVNITFPDCGVWVSPRCVVLV